MSGPAHEQTNNLVWNKTATRPVGSMENAVNLTNTEDDGGHPYGYFGDDNGTQKLILRYDLGTAAQAESYYLHFFGRDTEKDVTERPCPKDFTLEGSNDGTTFVVLDTRTKPDPYPNFPYGTLTGGYKNSSGGVGGEGGGAEYSIATANRAAYRYYQLVITSMQRMQTTTGNLNEVYLNKFGILSTERAGAIAAAGDADPLDSATTVNDAETIVLGRNAGNGEWKARKSDLKALVALGNATMTAANIFGTKADGSSRVPAGKAGITFTLKAVQTSRTTARANRITFASDLYVPLDAQGDSAAFDTSGDEVIEIEVQTAAADTSGTTTYAWYVMTDSSGATVAKKEDGVTDNSGTVDVAGEDTGSVSIRIGSTDYKFLLGGVTTNGTETVASSSGDPFVRPMFA